MGLKKIFGAIKPPCPKCPYTLGKAAFVRDPCPECRRDAYAMYYRLTDGRDKQEMMSKGDYK